MADEEELNLYDEIEIEDCFYDETLQIYHHPCPCGDRFEISIADMRDGEDIARCPSCSLMIRIIFDSVRLYFPARPSCANAAAVGSSVRTAGRHLAGRCHCRLTRFICEGLACNVDACRRGIARGLGSDYGSWIQFS